MPDAQARNSRLAASGANSYSLAMQLLDLTKMTAEDKAARRESNRERWEAVECFKARESAAMTDERA